MQSIQYLNTKAAQNVQKNVEGKITVALNEGVGNSSKNRNSSCIQQYYKFRSGKDKNGSAPSYKCEFLFIKKDKENEEAVAA